MSNENQAKPVAAALPASNEQGSDVDRVTELEHALMRMIHWFGRYPEFIPAERFHQQVGNAIAEAKRAIFSKSAATPALPVVPEGYKIVPLVPSEAMIQAGCVNQDIGGATNYEEWWDSHSSGISQKIRKYVSSDYRAMVLAAPELPEGNQQPQDDSGVAIRHPAEPSETALAALLTRIDDAAESYERFGEVCKFEGSSMIYAATLEEIVALRGAYHVAASEVSAPVPRVGGNTIPGEVRKALDRMCMPLHESRLDGCTAKEDARCMAIIKAYIESGVAPSHAASTEPYAWTVLDASDIEPLCTVHRKEATKHYAALGHKIIELFTHTATQVAQLTEQDAARWKFFCENAQNTVGGRRLHEWLAFDGVMQYGSHNAAIDFVRDRAAILANQSQKG